MHPTDDDLILHCYGEGGADEEARVDAHIRSCDTCQATFNELRDTLQLVDAAAMPEPGADFEARMWTRIDGARDRIAVPMPQTDTPATVVDLRQRGWTVRQWLPAAAWAATLVAVVSLGYHWTRTPVTTPAETAQVATAPAAAPRPGAGSRARERGPLTALDTHFQQTEMLLVELLNAPAGASELALERATADELVASGRLYRVTAEQNGHVHLADMLEDLEAVLVEVARSPEKPNRRDVESLRARIDNNDLLFKVRAVTHEIRERRQTLNSESE